MAVFWSAVTLLGLFCFSESLARKPCPSFCAQIYKPVCGSDGKTYGNLCMFQSAACKNSRLRLKHHGACKDPNKPCYGSASPLKNSKGKTLCCGRCAFRDVCPRGSFCHIHPTDRFSVCCPNRVKVCEKPCTKILRPVCGSDGKTYNNKCLFDIAKCKNHRLRLVKIGRCPRCEKRCTKILRPVCGSDGKTYNNKCLFDIAKCKNHRLRLVKIGPCPRCEKRCTKILRPVCGSDGKTYNNKCLFDIAKCKNHRLRLVKIGPCPRCEKRCTKILRPVCGSDGKTYNNKCLFDIAKCKNHRLRLVKIGPCPSVKPGRCPPPFVCRIGSCGNIKKTDRCQKDADCRGSHKCCPMLFGKRCTRPRRPCRVFKCRACQKGYKYATDRHGCKTCRCVCIRPVRCFVNPCQFAKCPAHPYARCRSNYCGGCHADFYSGSRKVNCKVQTKGK